MKILILLIIISLSLLIGAPTYALVYPQDAESKHFEFLGTNTTTILATSTRTILGIDTQLDAGQVWLYCNSVAEENEIMETHFTNLSNFQFQNYLCNSQIIIKTQSVSGLGGHFILTWIDYNLATATSTDSISIGNTPLSVEGNFTATTTAEFQLDPSVSNDIMFLVVIGIVVAGILGLDLIRRLFAKR